LLSHFLLTRMLRSNRRYAHEDIDFDFRLSSDCCLFDFLHFAVDRVIAAAPTHDSVQITAGPELETASDTLAIVRWTTTNVMEFSRAEEF
jgi:hypothetical protein